MFTTQLMTIDAFEASRMLDESKAELAATKFDTVSYEERRAEEFTARVMLGLPAFDSNDERVYDDEYFYNVAEEVEDDQD